MEKDSQTQQARIPNGPACAAMLACGIGVCVFGIAVVVAEASSSAAGVLNLIQPVGPLSGKVAVGILAWLVSWTVFQKLWGRHQVNFGKVRWAALALIFVGFALTFPPVFEMFGD